MSQSQNFITSKVLKGYKITRQDDIEEKDSTDYRGTIGDDSGYNPGGGRTGTQRLGGFVFGDGGKVLNVLFDTTFNL